MDFTNYKHYSDTFIETGTHIGTGVQKALDAGFTNVKSVEAYRPSFEIAFRRFKDDKRVILYFGMSTDCLIGMMWGIPFPSVFWLDAHPSGPNTAGHFELLAGNKECEQDNILKKELQIILNHGRHVILIDDQQGWATAQQFADLIDEFYPDAYSFELIDEDFPGIHHKEKILVCLPVL